MVTSKGFLSIPSGFMLDPRQFVPRDSCAEVARWPSEHLRSCRVSKLLHRQFTGHDPNPMQYMTKGHALVP